ncbi:MAG: FIST C-terminal domain-containing protein [Desulforhopalus sp.]|nr:FIST C-terminal domain-containing protein [Desulforhopalus sp.]
MFSFNIQYSSADDLFQAKQKLGEYVPQHLLIQVFSGNPAEDYVAELLGQLTKIFPGVPILGATTAGEIMDGASLEKTTVINFSRFDKTTVQTAFIDQNDDMHDAGRRLGLALARKDCRLAIVFGCGIKDGGAVNGEPLLAGFQEACPTLVISGGQAGDNGLAKQTFVFTEHGHTGKGAAAAVLSGDSLRVGTDYNLSWVPLGKKMTITAATGTCIHTIDNRPAKDLYSHYLGEHIAGRLPQSAAEFPLVVRRHGVLLARHANRVLPDGSLEFMAPFYTGETVQFSFCHSGLVAESARATFSRFASSPCDVVFIYSCLSRKWVLGEDSKLELQPLAGLAPTAGFFCYGEYFRNEDDNMFLSQTMTVLTLAEDGVGRADTEPVQSLEVQDYRSKQVQDLQALHRLVETSAEEREAVIKELQEALNEIKTLRGFIPICANCKNIRDDKGYWQKIEKYIQDNTEAQFSHGVCPDCMEKLYPEIMEKIRRDKAAAGDKTPAV